MTIEKFVDYLGRALRVIRVGLGLTPADVALRMRKTEQYIIGVEAGQVAISPSEVQEFADAYSVSFDAIYEATIELQCLAEDFTEEELVAKVQAEVAKLMETWKDNRS